MRESISLHALQLAREELGVSAGLKAEDLKRLIADLESQLPADLIFDSADDEPEPAPANPKPQLMAGAADPGMVGRLRVEGIDVGAQIQYKPGLALTPTAIDQILNSLNVQARALSLEFVGVIELAEQTTIRFVAAGLPDAGGAMTVMVGQAPVDLQREVGGDRFAGVIDLPAGMHLVRWRIGGKELKTCFVELQNDRDKQTVPVHHSASLVKQFLSPDPVRLRVNILGAN